MRAGIFSGAALLEPAAADVPRQGRRRADEDLVAQVRASPSMRGADLAGEVSTDRAYVVPATGARRLTVAAVDLGIKSMTPAMMAGLGIEVHVLPATCTVDDVVATGADGVFFSNGPGDPAATRGPIELLRELLSRRVPVFGICFGNQLLGRALGLETFKLTYGHRGINQPVLDRATGTVEVTAHNHGFAIAWPTSPLRESRPVDTPFGRVEVSHIGLNDDVVEGLRCLDVPAFSVQFHPEAAAGPHDSAYLFRRFVDLMEASASSPSPPPPSPPPAIGNHIDVPGGSPRQEGSQLPGRETGQEPGTGQEQGTGRGGDR
jgi:carbamoyl-phosphate synthase small subunit